MLQIVILVFVVSHERLLLILYMRMRYLFISIAIFLSGRHTITGQHKEHFHAPVHKIISEYLAFFRDAVMNIHYQSYAEYIDGHLLPKSPHCLSMLGQRRLDNYAIAIMSAVYDRIPGHIIETGVWRGGASMLAAKTIEVLGNVEKRKVFFCDSFKGIPKVIGKAVSGQDETAWTYHILNDNDVNRVREKVQSFGVDTSNVVYVEGYFNESIPALIKNNPELTFSVIRLDGDTYFSTMDAIKELYPRLNKGGFIIIDDYIDWIGCKRAIDDYRREHSITEPITVVPHKIGGNASEVEYARGVYWRKGVTNEEMPYCPGAKKLPFPSRAYTPRHHVDVSPDLREIYVDFRGNIGKTKMKMCV